MPMTRRLHQILFTCSLTILAACGGGGGGGGGGGEILDPPTAKVPEGTGVIAIDMAGIWEIRSPVVVESNSPNPNLPLEGTAFRFDTNEIIEIGNLIVTPDNLEVLLGPLETYVNQITPSTVLYNVVVDRRADGGLRDEIAVAGGASGSDSIAVEALASSQSPTDAEPTYTLSRYTLIRRNPTAPAQLPQQQPEQFLGATLLELFGDAVGGQ